MRYELTQCGLRDFEFGGCHLSVYRSSLGCQRLLGFRYSGRHQNNPVDFFWGRYTHLKTHAQNSTPNLVGLYFFSNMLYYFEVLSVIIMTLCGILDILKHWSQPKTRQETAENNSTNKFFFSHSYLLYKTI